MKELAGGSVELAKLLTCLPLGWLWMTGLTPWFYTHRHATQLYAQSQCIAICLPVHFQEHLAWLFIDAECNVTKSLNTRKGIIMCYHISEHPSIYTYFLGRLWVSRVDLLVQHPKNLRKGFSLKQSKSEGVTSEWRCYSSTLTSSFETFLFVLKVSWLHGGKGKFQQEPLPTQNWGCSDGRVHAEPGYA